jgi:hypothetical protein
VTAPPTNLNALAIRYRLGKSEWSVPKKFGIDGWMYVDYAKQGSIIVTVAPFDDGEWVHASLSWNDHMPTYDDLRWLHAAVFQDRWAYQVFAPAPDHVNISEHALHLFGRLDGASVLPDFTDGTGSI